MSSERSVLSAGPVLLTTHIIAHLPEIWQPDFMKAPRHAVPGDTIMDLQDEIRRNDEGRYDHRLYAMLLVAHGMSCREVGRILGDAPRTVAYWARRYNLNP